MSRVQLLVAGDAAVDDAAIERGSDGHAPGPVLGCQAYFQGRQMGIVHGDQPPLVPTRRMPFRVAHTERPAEQALP